MNKGALEQHVLMSGGRTKVPQGETGPNGLAGIDGTTGPQGPQRGQGLMGLTGPAEAPGPAGLTGIENY